MNRKLALIATAFLIVGSASAEKQAPPQGGPPKPFTVPAKQVFTLPNGIKVTMVPYGVTPKVLIAAVVRAGNLNEGPDQVWLADLTGELMKEGTQSKSAKQVADEAAMMGGQIGVEVGADETAVQTDVLSDSGPGAVALLADVLEHPALPQSEIERIKTDQLRRLSIEKSKPGSMATEIFRKTLYPNHPYGRVFPTEDMLKKYTIDDVHKFYGSNFGAARTRIYIAGKFDSTRMKKAVSDAFGNWAKGSDPVINVPKPVSQHALATADRPGAAQSTLYVGLPVIDPSNPDYIPLLVTNSLLGGSFGSRITSNIREKKGYTYSPRSQVSVRYRDGFWVEIADVTTAVTGPSLKEIFYEIDRLQKEPPSEAELNGIKNYMAGVFVLQNSSRAGLVGQLRFVDLHQLGDDYLKNYVQRVYAVTPEQVQQITTKYIRPTNMAIVVVGDQQKISDQIAGYKESVGQ